MTNKDNFTIWKKGYGVIKHKDSTVKRIRKLIEYHNKENITGDGIEPYALLAAADRIASMAMWLVVNQTYVHKINLNNENIKQDEFKNDPQGHIGGSLNMIPGYVGYMLANALTGVTRGWLMGPGHAVAAIDSTNLLLDNLTLPHKQRYSVSEEGFNRFMRDFYSYKINASGKQDSPLGSHVNPNTAGGIMEGGYLGFAQLQYAHMPLSGERLVAFLSDGAFEEQRGGDWTPRWWRMEDCGYVAPIMIYNGRRIDQRSTMSQDGGTEWLSRHLKVNHYDPIIIDGRDPAAFAWVIIESEKRLSEAAGKMQSYTDYPIKIPYGIAVAPKGAGFYNEGTNYAHNLPLATNPFLDKMAAAHFNNHAKKLFVPLDELKSATDKFQHHDKTKRKKERDNNIANRSVKARKALYVRQISLPKKKSPDKLSYSIPMDAIDEGFLAAVKANPRLRPRVGNPDEMKSNKMDNTLEELEFRVAKPEGSIEESTLGKVITALNEEAVAGAAFGNKGGINIIVTYEAFGAKMAGSARQEVIFSRHQKELGRPAGWLSVPLILTSHTWENGKNELSHQDPSMAEVMFAESSDISRVLFPADYNSSAAIMQEVYQTHGQVWTIVASKRESPDIFDTQESEKLIQNGGCRVTWAEYKSESAEILLTAVGGYQMREIMKAAKRLQKNNIPYAVSYLLEPGRFRNPRNNGEKEHLAGEDIVKKVFPNSIRNLILATHTRPESILGALHNYCNNRRLAIHGFINEGGTLNADGMLFVNKTSWAHIVRSAASLLNIDEEKILLKEEIEALNHKRSPDGIIL